MPARLPIARYHHGARWTDAFTHVVGVGHTNYLQYARLNNIGVPGPIKEYWVAALNNLVCVAYADVVVKLSATLADVPGNNLVCNVHGVRSEFLGIGAAKAEAIAAKAEGAPPITEGAYFLGKALWTKGYRELMDIMAEHRTNSGGSGGGGSGGGSGELPALDTYGSGPNADEIAAEVASSALPITMHGAIDHAHPSIHGYRLFVNPSTSDVLCTATAEALAMGKKVLIPRHPSNRFFEQFTNAHLYDDTSQMVPMLLDALATEPVPMSQREQYMLSWEAATERLLDAAALPEGSPRVCERPESTAAYAAHYAMGFQPVFDGFRIATGAPPVVPVRERVAAARDSADKARRAATALAERLRDANDDG